MRPMSMDKLDAVLAGLTTTEVTTKCALCGMGFPGPVELGEHMGVCTGLSLLLGEGYDMWIIELVIFVTASVGCDMYY
jgi:hypothetical protein